MTEEGCWLVTTCDIVQNARIRKCCARSYVPAVLSVASGMEGEESVVSDIDVHVYLAELLLGQSDPLGEPRGGTTIISLSSNSEGAPLDSEEGNGVIEVRNNGPKVSRKSAGSC